MKAKFKLKIITKLILGFGLILILFSGVSFYLYSKLAKNQELTNKASNNTIPSMSALNRFSNVVYESTHLVKNWVLYETQKNTPKKLRLNQINQSIYVEIKYDLRNLAQEWGEEEQLKLEQILNLADNYFILTEELMRNLNSPEKYSDPDFEAKYASSVQDNTPMMDLAENIKNQCNEMYTSKRDELLSYNIEMESSFVSFSNIIIISGIFLILIVLLVAFLFINSMITPVDQIRKTIQLMAAGEFPKQKIRTSTDEIGQTVTALEKLISGLRDKANFARDIEKGNFSSYFKAGGKNDVLGNSLLAMRDSLSKAAEEEKIRRKENEERNWSTQGISEFNTLIRDHSGNPEEFALVTINKLTRYTDSQVGGFYVLNERDSQNKYLELIAFYAYDRHKFFEKEINPGQNLVGQAYLEKDTIFISDVPENYIKISSGLGEKSPKSILIVPLIVNEKVYGVVELASLKIYEKYQIEFVEKIGEILASTIATIQINIQTAQILEESREKSEILEHQEKESIKNIEQLNTELENANNTIEQLNKKIQELEKIREEKEIKQDKETQDKDDKTQEHKKIIIDPDTEKRETEKEKIKSERPEKTKEAEKENIEEGKTEDKTELNIDLDLQKRKEEREKRRLERLQKTKEGEKENVEEKKIEDGTETKSIDPDLQKRKEEREKRRLERLQKTKEAEKDNVEEKKTEDGTELKSIDPDLQKRKEEREKRRLERLQKTKEAEKDNVQEGKYEDGTELKSKDPDLQRRKEEREKRRLERLRKRKEAENNEKNDDDKNE